MQKRKKVKPDGIFGRSSSPKHLFILFGGVVLLKRLFSRILLEVVQKSAGVGQPQCDALGVVEALDDALDAVDGAAEKTLELGIVVGVVRVSDAHEQNVGRKTR